MFFLSQALLVTYALGQQYWDIQTSFGPIRGQAVKTSRNQTGYAFLGVPFAAPPVQKASQSQNMEQYFECFVIQTWMFAAEKGNCPILFHVHGGMRNYCSAADIPPEGIVKNLANEERNIVVVTVQYRLGVLGWLNLHDEQNGEHSNVGLRDVLHALNWTNKEISQFGGDPTRLTLMGLSSGAEMVNEIVMPGVSNGLFHQIILMSAPHFGGRHKRVNRRFSEKLTTRIGCGQPKSKTELELSLACLRAKSEQEYLNTLTSFDVEVDEVFGTWIDGADGVFPKSIEEQLQRKMPNITALIGTTASEFPDTLYLDAHQNVRTDILDDVCVHIAYENYENPERFRHICNKFYNNASRILSLNDDYLYYESSSMFADKYSQSGKVFVYSYANPIPGMPIPLHATDANNILGQNYFAAEELSEADEKRQQIHSGMFANFIRSGNPSYEDILWTSWEPERRNYMVIDFDANGNIKGGMADGYHSDYHKFIKETVPREAGARLPEQSLPPEIDFFSQISMIYSIENFWKIEYPLLLGKTSVALRKMKALWTDHVRELRTLSIVPLSQSDQFTVILAVFLSIIMGYVLLKTYYDWRKRKNYIVLDGHNKC